MYQPVGGEFSWAYYFGFPCEITEKLEDTGLSFRQLCPVKILL